jgi:glycosyltransferase involved in cell wall biosynthesis
MSRAKIAVVIPGYNCEATLRPCLDGLQSSIARAMDRCEAQLIFVNDLSTDGSARIAAECGAQVINNETNKGPHWSRLVGAHQSDGEIILFVDSDIVVAPTSIELIHQYFSANPDCDAITGLLSCTDLGQGFSTDYKNLYMNFNFRKLPETVTFVYGSIFAVRRSILVAADGVIHLEWAEDTALGQSLFRQGKKIVLLKDLEVTHLKKYTLLSLLRNDFWVPFDWAQIFLKNLGWQQLGRKNTGFAHASKRQLIALILANLTVALFIFGLVLGHGGLFAAAAALFLGWLSVNMDFFAFIAARCGLGYLLSSIVFTFGDHIMMTCGIAAGFLKGPQR